MNIRQIHKMLRNGEGLHCEFKEAQGKLPKSLFESICAFLNADGGYLFLGVRDDGAVLGISPAEAGRIKHDLVNLSNNPQKLDPPYILFPEEAEIDGKTIVIVQVPVSSHLHKTGGHFYVRSEDGDYRVHGTHQLASLINRKMGLFSERRAMPNYFMGDLRPDLFDRARRLMLAHHSQHPWAELRPEQLLKIAGFHSDHPESGEPCLNLAAILMFGNDIAVQKAAPAYAFDCLLRRDNTERYDDRLQIRTNLIEAYDQMMGFVEKHLNDPFFLEGDQRVSLRDKIFREAVSNIVSHREYLHGTPGRLMIYRDRVVLDNPCTPHFMGIITPENLEPFSRNPVICQFMIQLGRFERLGSGVRNINKYLPLYANGASPVFEETDRGFKLTIPLANESAPPVAPPVTPPVAPPVGDYVFRLLKLLQQAGALSNAELLKAFNLKDRRRMRETYIYPAMSAGWIEYTIPDKPNSRMQKYRLTDKGKELLEKGPANERE